MRTVPKVRSSDATTTFEIGATDQLIKRRRVPAADRRVPQRRARPARPTSADGQDSVQDVRITGLANGKPAVQLHVFRQPAPTSSRPSTA